MPQHVQRAFGLQFFDQIIQDGRFRPLAQQSFQYAPFACLALAKEPTDILWKQGPFLIVVSRRSLRVSALSGQAMFDSFFKGTFGVGGHGLRSG